MPKPVLIITYYWPPSGGAGVQRWLKFSKYLNEYGITPIILTVNPSYAHYPALDEDLIKDEENILVYKTKTIEPFKWYKKLTGKKSVPFGSVDKGKLDNKIKLAVWIRANLFVPDARKLWKHFAVKKGIDLIEKYDIKTIISTSPPNSTHQIAYKLKKKTKVKWLADFRDPWTNNKIASFLPRTSFVKAIDKNIEKRIFSYADKITVVSMGMAEEYNKHTDKLHVLTNGFDPDDFSMFNRKKPSKFIISYNGNLKSTQNIKIFWEAIRELVLVDNEFSKDLVLQFVGKLTQESLLEIEKNKLNPYVNLIGYVPHSESILYLLNSALLYLPIPNAKGNKTIITGKIFEYLASGIPILSIGPIHGNANDILKEAKQLPMATYEDKELVKDNIIKAYKMWQNNAEDKNRKETLYNHPFSRKILTKQLANILKNMS